MLCANDAGIASQSPGILERMMPIIVLVTWRFGLLVSQPKTEAKSIMAKGMDASLFTIKAAGMTFNHTEQLAILRGNICGDEKVEDEINHRVHRAHACFRKNT